MKRTQVDFSNHQLDIIENEHVLIHTLHINNSNCNKVVFINCEGVLTVTGDFGNWVFCREFHPSADGFVSDGYWAEKLRMASEQTTSSFCSEETMKAIKEYRENFDENISGEEIEWLNTLAYYSEDEIEYTYHAYREKPDNVDYESVPFGKKNHIWLEIVFDAFDVICDKLKNK